jgi:molybdate transport system regulatory protein
MAKRRARRLTPHLKVWLEADGRPAFGDGKLTWLEAIDETGSLRAAAARLRMSYRGLWHRLRVMEVRLGRQLVTRQTGGAGGGGMTLTDAGRALVRDYRRFRRGIDGYVRKRFARFMRPRA